MEGYRDLYHVPVPAGYHSRYPLGYGVEGRSSYFIPAVDPPYPSYSRAALDAYAGYGSSLAYQPGLVPQPHDAAALQLYTPRKRPYPERRPNPKRRPVKQSNEKGRPSPAENLAPKKKTFKKTQKDYPKESKGSKQTTADGETLPKEQKGAGKAQKLSEELLVKETQELHRLFRTGVDSTSGKQNGVKASAKQALGNSGKKNANNRAAAQKRKAEEEKKVETLSSSKKRKLKKRSRKERQKEAEEDAKIAEAPRVTKAEQAALTEEEKKQMDCSLETQHAACKTVAEFLKIPEKSAEPEPEGEPMVSESKVETPAEAQEKTVVAPTGLIPEEEKELEEKGYTFFSKMLEENSELRKLYLEKKDAGLFECLICHSADPETSKKFNNLTSLVMHTSMRKQKRPEHRGYGKAICDILGWELSKGAKNCSAKQVAGNDESTRQVQVEKVNVDVGENKEKGSE